jgi:membrane protein implicated in regulation of membrane protease activity
MIRVLARCAVAGIIGIVFLKLLFGVIGFAFSLLWTLLWLAAIGFLFYLILKIINPDAARRVREKVAGKEKTES